MSRKTKYSFEQKLSAVEDYINGIRTSSHIANDLSMSDSSVLRKWVRYYLNGGPEALMPRQKNSSYSKDFKIKVVKEYLDGRGSYAQLCSLYNIPSQETLHKWVMEYNSHIELKDYVPKPEVYMAESRRKTTLEERIKIVEYCLEHDRNYKQAASRYDVSYQQVYSWVKKYDKGGEEALIDRRGHHKTDDELDELERLRRENKRLKRKLKEQEMVEQLLKKVMEYERM